MFEEVVRGPPSEVLARFREAPKGEITIVLGPAGKRGVGEDVGPEAAGVVIELVASGLSRRQAADVVSRLTGIPRNRLYRLTL
jgi:16S rRNA C1402 (ribose-2'-O) methylase RsmI